MTNDVNPQLDSEIRTRVDALRTDHPKTSDLCIEVAKLLRYRYNQKPTIAKLQGYLGKGSATTIALALRRFWKLDAARNRTHLDLPDLPDDVRISAGEFVTSLWATAVTRANESVSAHASDADNAVRSALDAQQNAEQLLATHKDRSEVAEAIIKEQTKTIAKLQQELIKTKATSDAMAPQIDDLRKSVAAARASTNSNKTDLKRTRALLSKSQSDLSIARTRAGKLEGALSGSKKQIASLNDLCEALAARSGGDGIALRPTRKTPTVKKKSLRPK